MHVGRRRRDRPLALRLEDAVETVINAAIDRVIAAWIEAGE
jgi:hypothetical protein